MQKKKKSDLLLELSLWIKIFCYTCKIKSTFPTEYIICKEENKREATLKSLTSTERHCCTFRLTMAAQGLYKVQDKMQLIDNNFCRSKTMYSNLFQLLSCI